MTCEEQLDNCLSWFESSTAWNCLLRKCCKHCQNTNPSILFSQGDIRQQTAGMLLHPVILQAYPRHTRQVYWYGERRLCFLQGPSLSDGEQSGQSGLWNHLQHWGNYIYLFINSCCFNQLLIYQTMAFGLI